MKSHFSASFFAANRQALRQRLQRDAPVVLAANGLLQRTGDTSYPFQQDSNFWYLTGLSEPDLVLVMTASSEFLIVPERDAVRQAFDGQPDHSSLIARSGIRRLETERAGWAILRRALADAAEVWVSRTSSPYDTRHGLWLNPAHRHVHDRLKRSRSGVNLRSADEHLAALRVIKQPAELAALQAAIDITAETLGDIQAQFDTFAHEYEVEAAITHGFRTHGASGHAFSPIVANGAQATILHNVASAGLLQKNALTVVDIGAEVEHYAADITRTVAGQKPSARQLAVHTAVLETQAYALTLLKPGVLPHDYERAVALFIGKQLQRLDLITHVDADSVRRYYPHAASHFLGLDVHDVGNYNEPLAAGMVLTCEPGIYIPEEGIGVRIEDDIYLTETGNRLLSAACELTFG